MYQAIIETKTGNKKVKESSPMFDNQLKAECWLHSCLSQAKELHIKVTDHYLTQRTVGYIA